MIDGVNRLICSFSHWRLVLLNELAKSQVALEVFLDQAKKCKITLLNSQYYAYSTNSANNICYKCFLLILQTLKRLTPSEFVVFGASYFIPVLMMLAVGYNVFEVTCLRSKTGRLVGPVVVTICTT